MFSFDLSHPNYPYTTIGAKCLTCYTDVWYYSKAKEQYQWFQETYINPTARLCKCKSVGCAVDDDSTFNLYVDDIRKVHLGHFIFNKGGDLLSTEWWNVSGSFIYVDYKIKTEAIQYKDRMDLTASDVRTGTEIQPVVQLDTQPNATNKAKQEAKQKNNKNRWGFDIELVKALDTHTDYQSRMFYYTNNWKVL